MTEDEDTEPKKPLSSYLLFCKEKRPMVVADFPGSNLDKGWLLDIKAKEITSKLGEMWKALSDEEKEIYVARFKESHNCLLYTSDAADD